MVEELVNVAVPRQHLARIYALVAELEGQLAPASTPAGSSPETEEQAASLDQMLEEWTPKRIQRMIEESPPAMRKILRALADRKGEWLSTTDLAQAIGSDADWNTVAGTIGAFGRRCYNRYQLNTLPYEGQWDHAEHCKKNRMPKQVADEVLRALKKVE